MSVNSRSDVSLPRPAFALVLGLLPPYTMEDVKRAYRDKVKDAHPDRGGDLFVNVGSSSDHCEDAAGKPPAPSRPCAEAEGTEPRGAIRRYQMRWPEGKALGWQTYAKGLRNSMAMAVRFGSSHRRTLIWFGIRLMAKQPCSILRPRTTTCSPL